MNFGLGIGLTTPLGEVAFSPVSLFADGEAGAWIDLTAVYQDINARTLAGSGDSAAVALDASQEMAESDELLVNGGFDTDTDWDKGTGWTIAAGVASSSGTNISALGQTSAFPVGLYNYRVSCTSFTSGVLTPRLSGGGVSNGENISSTGDFSNSIYAGASRSVFGLLSAGGGFVGSVDDASLTQTLGNHAVQDDGASQPTFVASGGVSFLESDGSASLVSIVPDLGTDATVFYATEAGSFILTGQTVSGTFEAVRGPKTFVSGVVDRALSSYEAAQLTRYMDAMRGDMGSIRQIATDAKTMDTINAAATQCFSRSHHRARDDISSMQIEFPNWYATSAESAPGADATIYASVEYPLGSTPVRVYFGGMERGTIPDGGVLLSDTLSISIPDGAEFAVKTLYENSAGILTTVSKGDSSTERRENGTGALSDQTLTATQPSTLSTTIYAPSAIIGFSSKPAFFLVGDSKVAGSGDTSGLEFKGELERTIGPRYAFITAGRSGASLSATVGSYVRRLALSSYCTHVVSQIGVNDIGAGRTSAQIVGDLETFSALFSQPFYQATITPRNTSTDGWATTVNQTVGANETERATLNNAIRAGVSGIAGHLEVADQVETSRNSGIWQAGYTADGVHPTATGYQAIEDSEVADPLT